MPRNLYVGDPFGLKSAEVYALEAHFRRTKAAIKLDTFSICGSSNLGS